MKIVEELYVVSTKQLFDPAVTSVQQRRLNHRETLRQILVESPDDDYARLLLAQSLIARADPSTYGYLGSPEKLEHTWEAQELILDVLNRRPDSSFAHHLWIHVNDLPELAGNALNSATMLGSMQPEQSHAQHMPSHVYMRLGDYSKTVQSNLDAIEVNPYDGHSKQFLNYAYLNLGMAEDSKQLISEFQETATSSMWAAVRFHFMTGNYIINFFGNAPFLPNSLTEMPLKIQVTKRIQD